MGPNYHRVHQVSTLGSPKTLADFQAIPTQRYGEMKEGIVSNQTVTVNAQKFIKIGEGCTMILVKDWKGVTRKESMKWLNSS